MPRPKGHRSTSSVAPSSLLKDFAVAFRPPALRGIEETDNVMGSREPGDNGRLSALHDLRILDTPPEPQFDALCRTAASLFSVPIALVSLVDRDRQWFKATCGLNARETPRDMSFCSHAILSDEVLVVEDAAQDPRFAGNPLVTGDPGIRFYAGAPLILRSGLRLGTLCIIDTAPRSLAAGQVSQLRDLAEVVTSLLRFQEVRIECGAELTARRLAGDSLAESEARYRALTNALPQMVWATTATDRRALYTNAQFRTFYGPMGPERAERVARNHPEDAAHMAATWERAAAEERPYEVEGRLRRQDGVYRWHKVVMIPVRRDGAVVEWVGTALDIDDIVSAHAKLEETTELLCLAQQAAGAAVWDWDVSRRVARHSPRSALMYGLTPLNEAAVEVTAAEWESRVHPDDLAAVWASVASALEWRGTFTAEFRVVRPVGEGGGHKWIQAFGRVVTDAASGEPARIVGLHLDVTARREAEEGLRRSEARLRVSEERLALDSGDDGLWDWDLATGEAWVSDRWHRMLGHEGDQSRADLRTWKTIIHPADAERSARQMRQHLKGLTPLYECEYRLRKRDGGFLWVLTRGRVVHRAADGRALRMVGTQIDITRRKEAEQRIEHMALHDALTGLPNRSLFRTRLSSEIAHAARDEGVFAVLVADLDAFKAVNDSLGHPAGDELLRIISDRLRSVVREGDTVARLGGDEFALILTRLEDAGDASRVALRVINAVGQPVDLDGHLISVGVSIGIAMGPDTGTDVDQLFKNADIALYRAKAAGRSTYRFYEPGMDAAVAERNLLQIDIRDAVARGGFTLHYQPVVDLARDEVSGFEALLRWSHPTRGMISPADFVPIAEDSGIIVPLGDWALRAACATAAGWPGHLRVAVNVSAVQFRQPGLEQSVVRALAASGLPACQLELEITESVLLADAEAVVACLHRLRELGVRIALDDFGTGYSSLSYLRRFPFDKIKIDRSFIREIGDPDTAAIVRAVAGLGARLGTVVTAEGVETATQLEQVRNEGCTEVQGFLFGRPLPETDVRAFLRDRDLRATA